MESTNHMAEDYTLRQTKVGPLKMMRSVAPSLLVGESVAPSATAVCFSQFSAPSCTEAIRNGPSAEEKSTPVQPALLFTASSLLAT